MLMFLTVPTTPMMVQKRFGSESSPRTMRLPIGDSSLKYFFASTSSITITCSAPCSSDGWNVRPASTGMSIALKKSSSTTRP